MDLNHCAFVVCLVVLLNLKVRKSFSNLTVCHFYLVLPNCIFKFFYELAEEVKIIFMNIPNFVCTSAF